MRQRLSEVMTQAALKDPRVVVLSGDHGYALFDQLRKACPNQFINVGVAEQSMIGIAAGLARSGFLPIAYGLAAFVPIRVLEQIKLDLCLAKLQVILLGDGAGLVYSTLGSSHQCAEDIATLRPMPNLRIYSPADAYELAACFQDAISSREGPSYIRIGKSDRPAVHSVELSNTGPSLLTNEDSPIALIGVGSMASAAAQIAKENRFDSYSMMRIKPFPIEVLPLIEKYETVYVLEEHHEAGGVYSAIAEKLSSQRRSGKAPRLVPMTLKDRFSEFCGSHEYALSEHGLTTSQISAQIQQDLKS